MVYKFNFLYIINIIFFQKKIYNKIYKKLNK